MKTVTVICLMPIFVYDIINVTPEA